ncbi:MAG: PfkB family carbohydrate kinase [Blautia sp.]
MTALLIWQKRGIQTSAITTVGTDLYGKEMLDLCKEYEIDSSHIQVNEGDTSVFYMTLKTGLTDFISKMFQA